MQLAWVPIVRTENNGLKRKNDTHATKKNIEESITTMVARADI